MHFMSVYYLYIEYKLFSNLGICAVAWAGVRVCVCSALFHRQKCIDCVCRSLQHNMCSCSCSSFRKIFSSNPKNMNCNCVYVDVFIFSSFSFAARKKAPNTNVPFTAWAHTFFMWKFSLAKLFFSLECVCMCDKGMRLFSWTLKTGVPAQWQNTFFLDSIQFFGFWLNGTPIQRPFCLAVIYLEHILTRNRARTHNQ